MPQLPTIQPRGFHPPVSNVERQREFRRRHPGYYGRLHAKSRAACKARVAAARGAERAMAAMVARSKQLLLPAPVELPVIPGLNSIEALREKLREIEALPVSPRTAGV